MPDRALISFLRNNQMLKKIKEKKINISLKTNSNRNCKSNKYCTDGECSVNVRDLPLS